MTKIQKKMDFRTLLVSFNFAMIYIIHKMLILIKNHLYYYKDNIFEFFCKNNNRLLFLKKLFFS